MKRSRGFSRKGKNAGGLDACLVAFCLFLVPGCAGIERRLSERPFDPQSVTVLVADLQEQRERVQSFLSSGRLWVKGGQGEAEEVNLFSAGTRTPFRIKIEVTHPWGQPLLHLLVDGGAFRLLSFNERKFYFGAFTRESLSRFFPEEMDPNLIWDLLRAYPALEPPYQARSDKAHQIVFSAGQGSEEQVIALDRDSRLPRELILPNRNIKLVFSDLRDIEGIRYARETALVHVLGGRRLIHKVENMVFNKDVPGEVFTLNAPPGFEIVPLN